MSKRTVINVRWTSPSNRDRIYGIALLVDLVPWPTKPTSAMDLVDMYLSVMPGHAMIDQVTHAFLEDGLDPPEEYDIISNFLKKVKEELSTRYEKEKRIERGKCISIWR
jgi:hypothetical protein